MTSQPEPSTQDAPMPAFNLIAGERRSLAGDAFVSTSPADPSRVIWSGAPRLADLHDAVGAARAAAEEWAVSPIERRIEVLRAFQSIAASRAEEMGALISAETGKAIWDSMGEAKLLAGKVDVTLATGEHSGRSRVTSYETPLSETRMGVCSYRPHGVLAVLGPFNFPAHLPNGHIVPALLTGNTIVFKPSDKTPAVGQLLGEMFTEAIEQVGAPKGVFNLVQGAAEIAAPLASHEGVDGVLFTGSWPVGRRILEANLDSPGRIVALELGGNNPAVVMPSADLKNAVIECVRAAFITTGQRCTCTRRIVLHREIADAFIKAFCKATSNLIIGDPNGIGGGSRNQPVFMGPIITAEARQAVLDAQAQLIAAGGESLVTATAMEHPSGGHYVTPGVVAVQEFVAREDGGHPGSDFEVFGPLVRIAIVDDLEGAIRQANATRYGLASSIFTSDQGEMDRYLARAKAGCVNINTGTAGASGKLPFGGIGLSGNHRPAGAYSLDYTAYPVASMVERAPQPTMMPGMHFEDSWLG